MRRERRGREAGECAPVKKGPPQSTYARRPGKAEERAPPPRDEALSAALTRRTAGISLRLGAVVLLRLQWQGEGPSPARVDTSRPQKQAEGSMGERA